MIKFDYYNICDISCELQTFGISTAFVFNTVQLQQIEF